MVETKVQNNPLQVAREQDGEVTRRDAFRNIGFALLGALSLPSITGCDSRPVAEKFNLPEPRQRLIEIFDKVWDVYEKSKPYERSNFQHQATLTAAAVLSGKFKYDRKINTILFKAAWGALSEVLGVDERELAAIFTVQTAGEALNYHPHLHGLLAEEGK